MTAAPRDPLTLLEELLPYAERLLKASCDGAHGELASAPDAMHLSELLAEIDQRLTAVAECDSCHGTGEYFTHADHCENDTCALNGDIDSCLGQVVRCECQDSKALAPGGRDEPAAYLFTVRRTGKGRVDQFAAIDFVPGPNDGEILAKEPLVYLRPQPPAQPAPDPQWQMVEPTEAMIAAYLEANTKYWLDTDQLRPQRPDKWRNGTPHEATLVSLRAALAAAPQPPSGWRAIETMPEQEVVLLYVPYNGRYIHVGSKFTRDDGIIWTIGFTTGAGLPTPLAWMSLPPPPTSDREAGRCE